LESLAWGKPTLKDGVPESPNNLVSEGMPLQREQRAQLLCGHNVSVMGLSKIKAKDGLLLTVFS
jgi:hypothetical protein